MLWGVITDRRSCRLVPVLVALGAAVALLVSGCAGANAATNSDGYRPPPIKHVWTIILENYYRYREQRPGGRARPGPPSTRRSNIYCPDEEAYRNLIAAP